ncbi:MAG: sigma-70 family RNA polymerase sigma factor [Polyangiaceae bacterium]
MRKSPRSVREKPVPIKDDVDDVELLFRLIQNHPRALRASWIRFAPLVHRLLKRALGPEDDVRELVQLVFVQFHRHSTELADPTALRPLVLQLTTKTIRAELRHRWARRWLRIGQAEAPPRTSIIPPPDSPSREALRRLYRRLDRCKTEDRIAFAFHFLEGLSLEEVAEALNLTLPATQEVLAHAWHRIAVFVEHDTALLDYLCALEGQGACA